MAAKSTPLQTCIDVIATASKDALSSTQAKQLVQRIMDEVERRKGAGAINAEEEIRKIGTQIIEQDKLLTAIQKRNAYLTVSAEKRVKEYVKKFATPGEGLRAFMNGSSKVVESGRNSVYYQGVAIKDKYVGRLKDGLEKNGLMEYFKSGDLDQHVFKELWELNRPEGEGKPGISGSPKAAKMAEIINGINLEMIERENRAGAYVRPLEGYIIRQTHDPDAIRRAGGLGYGPDSSAASFRAWSEFILPLLDHDKTFAGVEDPVAFLKGAHEGILSGLHNKPTEGNVDVNSAFNSTGAMAKKVSQPRVLHFQDADAAFKYNQTFGIKDFKEAVLQQISLRSRAISLMENFGPNPERTFDRLIVSLKNDAKGSSDDVRQMTSLNDWRVKASMNELLGKNDIPGNPSVARMFAGVRAIQNMAKLGGATITSIADKAFLHSELTYQGISHLDAMTKSITAVAEGRPSAERQSMLNLMGAAMDGFIGNVVTRFSAHDNRAGMLFKLQQKFFSLNGMNWWNDVHKGAAAEIMSAHLAEHADARWEAPKGATIIESGGRAHYQTETGSIPVVPAELKNVLSLYGIEGDMWDVIREAAQEVEGRKYITPDALLQIPDGRMFDLMEARKIASTANNLSRMRDEVDTRLRTYFADRVDIAVPTPGNEERVLAHWNSQAGTPLGEAVRLMMQFKAMPITVLKKVVGREIYGHGSDTMMKWLQNDRTGNFRMAQLIAMATAGGYVAGAIKDALKGRTPKDPTSPKTFQDALLRGGGLGIYGDFLFNEYDRSYRSALGTLAGPVVGQLDQVASIYTKLKQGENVSSESGKLLLGNTPFINLFYIRPVLDYLVLWNLQEMTDPGSLHRSERRVERENGQGFFVRPSDTVHSR
jgi:hypothetical protein